MKRYKNQRLMFNKVKINLKKFKNLHFSKFCMKYQMNKLLKIFINRMNKHSLISQKLINKTFKSLKIIKLLKKLKLKSPIKLIQIFNKFIILKFIKLRIFINYSLKVKKLKIFSKMNQSYQNFWYLSILILKNYYHPKHNTKLFNLLNSKFLSKKSLRLKSYKVSKNYKRLIVSLKNQT